MIEKLRKKDIPNASKVYNKGLLVQVPKWRSTLDKTVKKLNGLETFVYKDNGVIKGLASFMVFDNGNLKLDFIYAVDLRKGVGKKLMKRLASFALKNDVKYIISEVSAKDKRVIAFYESCGFRNYGEHKVDKSFTLVLVKAKPKEILKRVK